MLNVSDGSEFLQLTFSGPIEASATFSMQHQYIFIGCYDGNMYCISLCSKEIIWHYQTNDKIKCKPTICKSDTAIVFGSYDKYVYCVHIEVSSLYIVKKGKIKIIYLGWFVNLENKNK